MPIDLRCQPTNQVYVMRNFSASLQEELHDQLQLIHQQTDDPLVYSEQAIIVLITLLEKLKTFFAKYKFKTKNDEMEFFKEIKPGLASQLIYYNEIYNIESAKPFAPTKAIKRYYRQELDKLQLFAHENIEFYRYYRKGCQHLDDCYFLRGRHDVKLSLDSYYFQADQRFSTSHDYKVARILANDLIKQFIEGALEKLDGDLEHKNEIPQLKWTAPKVALVELIYALHTERVFNHGANDLNALVSFFAKSFDTELSQYHRTFYEISARKYERTKFLSSLTENLLRRMDDRDAH